MKIERLPEDCPASPTTIRLLIVDDHAVIREGLRLAFEGTQIDVVAEAVDGQSAYEALARQPVDVALVDIRMPGKDGFHFLERVREAGLKLPVVLMHSVNDGSDNVRRCRALGASGVLSKGQDKDELLDAIRRVHAGEELWLEAAGASRAPQSLMVS